MRSTVVKRSVVIGKKKASISLEDEFWTGLKEIAAACQTTRSDLLVQIRAHQDSSNLFSVIRLFVL
jgi:predicted DNA-binding ribbon-helix-helix protein